MFHFENDQHISRLRDLREEDDLKRQKQKGGLPISQPGDASEKEADTIGKKVSNGELVSLNSSMQSSAISTKTEGGNAPALPGLASQLIQTKGSGQALDDSTRSELELKMGTDFSGVKVHTDTQAHNMSAGINAKAFTHGQDIYFKEGNYNPQSKDGKELLAHELVHTKQQSNMLQPMIQRGIDPVPNRGNPDLTNYEDQETRGYMPYKEQFKANFASKTSVADKVALIDKFVNEFFNYYKTISDPTVNIFQKSLNIQTLAEQVDSKNEIRGFPLTDYTSFSGTHMTNSFADWGKFKESDDSKEKRTGTPIAPEDKKPANQGYASMMILDQAANKEAIDLLDLKKADNAAYLLDLESKITADSTGDKMADLAASLRKVGDHVNRLWAVYNTSQATGMPFNDVMAFYGQESFFTMPSSFGSIADNIPTMETGGLSIANNGTYRFDFSTMNLIVSQNYSPVANTPDTKSRQIWALLMYSLQISGSDAAFHRVEGKSIPEGWLDALAAWSLENRKGSAKDPTMPSSELPGTNEAGFTATLRKNWEDMALTIGQLSPQHRKAGTYTGSVPLENVWVFVPTDAAKMTSFILTESTFLLKSYQNKARNIFGGDEMFTSSLAYMFYNSTTNNSSGEGYMKSIISSAAAAAIKQSKLPISGSGAMTSAFQVELKSLYSSDFSSVSAWVKTKPERWEMLMNFMEKAGQDEWAPTYSKKPKTAQRVNSSNFRTLSEFYKKVME